MIIIRKQAFARAGLLGNPSDGYNGKTISVMVRNFCAEVVLYEWDYLDIVLTENDRAHFDSVFDLAKDVKLHGYYGGIRLIKATIKHFVDYCGANRLKLHKRNFSIRYHSTIPRQVGLGGSSAIIVATLRCLMEFYDIAIPLHVQPSFVLSVEKDGLGIAAGLQDRVIQVYEGMVYMDFSKACEQVISGYQCYTYEPLDTHLLPSLYIAYHADLSEPTEVFHNDLQSRYVRGDRIVTSAISRLVKLADTGRSALLNHDTEMLGRLINENFDIRRSIYTLPAWQIAMVETARKCGASAHFTGSGGAILGTYPDESTFKKLSKALSVIGSKTVKLHFPL